MQQRYSKWVKKNEKKNKKMISVGEKSTKNVKMKKIIEKKSSEKKKNFHTMMFEIVDVKNSNAKIFMKYHFDDTTTTFDNFMKFFFEFENFLREKNATQTHKKIQKKRVRKRTKTKISRRRRRGKQMNEFLFFIWYLYK